MTDNDASFIPGSDRSGPSPLDAERDVLIQAALAHVPFDGWSMACLRKRRASVVCLLICRYVFFEWGY